MTEKKIYIGVVGQIAVGKGKLVEYLTDKLGFSPFSLSTIVHEELEKSGATGLTRKMLQDKGDELRKNYGDAVLAERAVSRMERLGKKKVVIEGIRNPGEIEFLKKMPHFVLVGVKAYRELRYKRLLHRAKPWDPKTWTQFLVVDRRDLGVGQKKSGQQVGKCLHYCDYILTNNKDIKDFQRKVKKLMEKIAFI